MLCNTMVMMIGMAGLSLRPTEATASGRSPALVDRSGSGRMRFAHTVLAPLVVAFKCWGVGRKARVLFNEFSIRVMVLQIHNLRKSFNFYSSRVCRVLKIFKSTTSSDNHPSFDSHETRC